MNDAAVWQVARKAPRASRLLLRSSCSVALRAQRASVRSLHVRTVPPSHAESIESAQVLSSMVPRGQSCISGGSTYRVSPVARARAPPPTNPPPSSPLSCALLPCDCPILRPRAGLLLSRACDFPFAMSFGATYAHASPLILAARCWLLHICAETRQAPFKLAAACGPISLCCRISHAA